jgi:hypothetical protein
LVGWEEVKVVLGKRLGGLVVLFGFGGYLDLDLVSFSFLQASIFLHPLNIQESQNSQKTVDNQQSTAQPS